jgi:adenylate cyclase
MPAHNADITADQRIEFRVGIHQGDVIVEDGDVFYDGINVAARLEPPAQVDREEPDPRCTLQAERS